MGVVRSTRFKGVAVFTAVTLAAAPLGFGGFAYGVSQDPEAESHVAEDEAALDKAGSLVPIEEEVPGKDADKKAPEKSDDSAGDASSGEGAATDDTVTPDDDPATDEGAAPDDEGASDDGSAPDDGNAPDEGVGPDDDGTMPDDGSGDEAGDPTDPDDGTDEPDGGNDSDSGQPDPVVPVDPVTPVDPQPVVPSVAVPDSAFASPSASGSATAGVVTPSSGTYTPHHYSHNLTTEKFIAVVGEQARQVGQERDLYASVMIAQAILESASGNSTLAQAPNNNLFGIKGSWQGKSVSMRTMEDDGSGLYFAIIANFRAYDSITDSLEDYADLLTDGMGGYYRGAWKSNAETPAQACDFLQGRYATSTSYSASLQDLIETYDLTRFDEPLDFEPVDSYEMPLVDEETGQTVLDEAGNPVMEERTLADLLAEATSHLGTEYVWGAADPETGFDCSGLVQYSYREALGIDLPRTTYGQWKLGTTVSFDDLRMGDLLFFESDGDVHHVALYLGDGYYIQAPQTGDVVKVTSMEEYAPSFAQRIVETRPVEGEVAVEAAEAAVGAEVAGDLG